MASDNIIHMRVKSAQEMGFLGQAFGTHFLKPLIENPDEVKQPVVAMYGIPGSGKTPFSKAACGIFDRFLETAIVIKPKSLVTDFEYDHMRLRHFDLGEMVYHQLPYPRVCIRSELEGNKPGFDFVEHATMPHFKEASVIAVVQANLAGTDITDFSKNYFYYIQKGIMDACKSGVITQNYEYVIEVMQQVDASLQNWLAGPECNQHARFTYQPERDVHLIPIRHNPAQRVAFDNLREQLRQGLGSQ